MTLLGWIVVGLLAGALAQAATGTRSRGCLSTLLVGILGAVVGGFIFRALGEPGVRRGGLWSVFVAFVGASILLLVLEGPFGNRRR